MLHDAQRTSAPSAFSVSIKTAVWIVMCSEPAIRAPFNGCDFANSSRVAISPGISTSAMAISLRPQSASVMSLTTKSWCSAIAGSCRKSAPDIAAALAQGKEDIKKYAYRYLPHFSAVNEAFPRILPGRHVVLWVEDEGHERTTEHRDGE